MIEHQRRHHGRAGNDAHVLDAEQQEGRPQQVDELGGEQQRAERDARND